MSLLLLVLSLQDPKAPDGFSIEKISPADVAFPMFGCLDDRGRLYVTESSGGDLYLELQKQVRKCRIRRIDGETVRPVRARGKCHARPVLGPVPRAIERAVVRLLD